MFPKYLLKLGKCIKVRMFLENEFQPIIANRPPEIDLIWNSFALFFAFALNQGPLITDGQNSNEMLMNLGIFCHFSQYRAKG